MTDTQSNSSRSLAAAIALTDEFLIHEDTHLEEFANSENVAAILRPFLQSKTKPKPKP